MQLPPPPVVPPVLPEPDAEQEKVGQVVEPFFWMVRPQLLPLPLGVATITYWLGQVALTFQVALICSGAGTFIVTVQLFEPDTETLRLYRSPHTCPADSVAVQPPTLSFGIGGTLPLFYFQRGEIMKASADLRVQQLQRAKAEAAVVADVEAGYNSFVSTRRLVARMEARLLDRSRRARDLVSLQYQKGAASLLEYLDAQRTFIANNEEYLQDLANYWTAVYQLEAAIGMDLR